MLTSALVPPTSFSILLFENKSEFFHLRRGGSLV